MALCVASAQSARLSALEPPLQYLDAWRQSMATTALCPAGRVERAQGRWSRLYRRSVMEPLTQQRCVACRAGAPTVTTPERDELQRQVPDWQVVTGDGVDRLERRFPFKN